MELKFFNFLSNKSPQDNSFFVLIDNKTFIVELLKQVEKSRKSITLFLGTSKKVFKTFIDVVSDENSSYFITEYISFLNLYKSKFESEDIYLVFNNNNIYYGFKTSFLKFINKNQLKLQTPNEIHKLQRREFVRVKQSISMPIKIQIAPYYRDELKDSFDSFIKFWNREKKILQPSVVDISEGGVSVIIYSDTKDLVDFHIPIFRMKLKILEKDISVISRVASIISLSSKNQRYRYRIGFAFRNISNKDKTTIKEYIMERQSEILKNRKRNL